MPHGYAPIVGGLPWVVHSLESISPPLVMINVDGVA